jgi:hypothetical protein
MAGQISLCRRIMQNRYGGETGRIVRKMPTRPAHNNGEFGWDKLALAKPA